MRSISTLLLCATLCAAAVPAGATEPPLAPMPGGPETLPAPPSAAGPPLTLDAALTCTLQCNPDLIAIRQSLPVSAEALNVARQFPTTLNPTLALEVQPWIFFQDTGGGAQLGQTLVTVSLQQPLELGHRTRERTAIAQAAYSQTRWNILQAELGALIETYRAHQTAVYRRDKLASARQISQYQSQLLDVLRRQREANQVPAADVVLAEVENVAIQQDAETARQEYLAALATLRRKIGLADDCLSLEPAGALQTPGPLAADNADELVHMALEARPEVRAAWAQVCQADAALRLAQADRIPIPAVGPFYEHDESGTTFYGFGVTSEVPILNSGRALVGQREAECHRDRVAYQQTQQRVRIEVMAALARWNELRNSAAQRQAWAESTAAQAARMRDLYDAGQSDLVKLLGVRRRLIEVQFVGLDAAWQTTQAYADLLAATGATPLLACPEVIQAAAAGNRQR